jgi:hypothetical protein
VLLSQLGRKGLDHFPSLWCEDTVSGDDKRREGPTHCGTGDLLASRSKFPPPPAAAIGGGPFNKTPLITARDLWKGFGTHSHWSAGVGLTHFIGTMMRGRLCWTGRSWASLRLRLSGALAIGLYLCAGGGRLGQAAATVEAGVARPRTDVIHLRTYPHNRRSQRRLPGEKLQFEEVPLAKGYGTHFSYVYVGTPPQRASVIIDTGSHYTAFPCNECSKCGTGHTDDYWNLDASSSAHVLGCNECQSARCDTKGKDRCVFGQSYSEGSSWNAFQVRDKLYLGGLSLAETPPDDKEWTLDFLFGCINSQNGLFLSQLADGIMGMSADSVTLIHQMYNAGVLKSRSFSLCFHEDGGSMVIGGSEPLLWQRGVTMQFTPNLKDSGWYTVKVEDVKLNGASIGNVASFFQRGKGAIVDSGTTDTYLPSGISAEFKAAWKSATGTEFVNKAIKMDKADMLKLPTITYSLAGGVDIDVLPEAYMEYSGATYTPRVYLDESSGAVLGANTMRDYEVFFDEENRRVGFARSNCAFDALQEARVQAAGASEQVTTAPTEATTSEGSTDTPTTAACDLAEDMILVEPCNASCPAEDPPAQAEGVEIWKHQYASEKAGSSCPALDSETRPCVITCDVADACVQNTAWAACNAGCSQTRDWILQNGQCEIAVRPCHIGPQCPASKLGLLVSGSVKVSCKAKPPFSFLTCCCMLTVCPACSYSPAI